MILLAALVAIGQPPRALDVSTVKIGAPAAVVELDLGKLKGELREIGWSPDDSQLYVQTGEGPAASPKLHHYTVSRDGGAVAALDAPPPWAEEYWAFKSDRSAPGLGYLMIDISQKQEIVKAGTGYAGALDREAATPGAAATGNIEGMAKANDQNQKANVVRLSIFGETISEFVNERPIPGLYFGWGPSASGALAFADPDGRLLLLDQNRHKQAVAGAKGALLPAWSRDGGRLAWAQRTGRRKFALMVAAVER